MIKQMIMIVMILLSSAVDTGIFLLAAIWKQFAIAFFQDIEPSRKVC